MRLSARSMAVAGGLLWGSAILLVGLINLAKPTYGAGFLEMLSSLYPWFHASRTFGDVMMGTIDGVVDGAIAGWVLAWLYNLTSQQPSHMGPRE